MHPRSHATPPLARVSDALGQLRVEQQPQPEYRDHDANEQRDLLQTHAGHLLQEEGEPESQARG